MPVEENALAVVVGGAGGIGAACCRLFARDGWKVAVADIDLAAATALAGEIGGEAHEIDLSDMDSIRAFAAAITAGGRGPRALVNSAAWFHDVKRATDLSEEDWDRTFSVCAKGPYFLTAMLARAMAANGGGSVVNIASTAGVRSAPLHAYGPAKAALLHMTECLSAEFGRSGIRVNAVTPSLTRTPALEAAIADGTRFVPDVERHTVFGRLVEPDEVAETVLFLAGDEASAITGANLPVDAGSLLTSSWQMFGGLRTPQVQN